MIRRNRFNLSIVWANGKENFQALRFRERGECLSCVRVNRLECPFINGKDFSKINKPTDAKATHIFKLRRD